MGVDVVENRVGRSARASFSHNVDCLEYVESFYRQHDCGEDRCVRKKGNGDVFDLLPLGGTIYFGRLVQVFRNVLQAGEIHDHVVTRYLPNAHDA